MEFLGFTQGDGRGSLATYMQDFNQMLIVVPLKEKYAKKLILLHGLKPWVQKIVYIKGQIFQTIAKVWWKWWNAWRTKAFMRPKGEVENGVTYKNQVDLSNQSKGLQQMKLGLEGDKEKSMGK